MRRPKSTGLSALVRAVIYNDYNNADASGVYLCGSQEEVEYERRALVAELWKHKIDVNSLKGEYPTEEEFANMADDWGAWTDWEEEMTNTWAVVHFPASEIMHVMYTAPHLLYPEIHTVNELTVANQIALHIIRRERDRIGFPEDMNLVHCWQHLRAQTDGRESIKIIPSATAEMVWPEENLMEDY